MSDDRWTFGPYSIPVYMREPLTDYINHGYLPGGFLTAVLENNLRESVGHADSQNITQLPAYTNYLYNYAPLKCWGSPKKVTAWIEAKETERSV